MFLLIAFGGFLPSYWMPVAAGSFRGPPILHVHGLLFFAWTLYYVAQTALVAGGRTATHRSWGMLGVALFSVMMCSIVLVTIASMRTADMLGFGDNERRFVAISLTQIPLLVIVFVLAIANVRRPETHKRLMLLLMSGMMAPAIARLFLVVLAPPDAGLDAPPPIVSLPGLFVADLLLIPALIRDRRTLGRIHPVYAWGLPITIVRQILAVPFAGTAAWMATARGIEGLLG